MKDEWCFAETHRGGGGACTLPAGHSGPHSPNLRRAPSFEPLGIVQDGDFLTEHVVRDAEEAAQARDGNTPTEPTLADVVEATDALEKFTITAEPADPAELVREALDGLSEMVAYVETLAAISAALEADGFSGGIAALVEFDYADGQGGSAHYQVGAGRLRLLGNPSDPEHVWGLTGYEMTDGDERNVPTDFDVVRVRNIKPVV